MAVASRSDSERNNVLSTVTRLVTAADGDTLYRDVYLRRGAEQLAAIVSEARYESALTSREQLNTLLAQARAAVGRQDWAQVREVGTRAAELRRSLDSERETLAAADAVYTAPAVVPDPLSPGIPIATPRWTNAAQVRQEVSAALTELVRDDAAFGQFYAARQRALASLTVRGGMSLPEAGTSSATTEQQALQAIERGDAAAVQALADAMLGKTSGATQPATAGPQSARARLIVPTDVGEPLPESCVPRARALGLEPVQTTPLSPDLSRPLTEFLEQHALGASPAIHERAIDGVARLTVAASKIALPPEVAAMFAETILQFAMHVFVNSAGLRYVPVPVEQESLLIESHAEGDDAITPLLHELGLDRRRGVARNHIEARLRAASARVLADDLGLDPNAFRIVCVPPDLYMRLGRDRGWGRREEWTHFDGYQLIAGGRLRALVGGNARYAGLFDLCSISRDDARDNTVVRLAVIRRERLGVRIGFDTMSDQIRPPA
jgi:hypothetical protein